MSEGKFKNGWGIYALRKFVEYAGVALAIWQLGIPAANQWYVTQRETYDHKHKSIPLRQLLSEESGIQEDRLHIVFGQWYKSQAAHDSLIESAWPLLEEEMNSITPRLIIKENREFWVAENGEYYRVYRSEIDGRGSYYKGGKWNYIYW